MKVITASGERSEFSETKVASSLRRAGAQEIVIEDILRSLGKIVHEDITTKEIYRRAFDLLRKQDGLTASRYKLKKAIYELGPTGFPFEKFIAAIFQHSGFKVEVGKTLQGSCVSHEVDVIAQKDDLVRFMECKFHSEQGKKCDVKIPLYIHSRFVDLESFQRNQRSFKNKRHEGWVVTNTRFTKDAITYGNCVGLNLLGWDFPKGKGLKEQIDKLGLYPITVSSHLASREKQFLLSRDVVLCRQLLKDNFFLDKLEVSENRKKRILREMEELVEPFKKSMPKNVNIHFLGAAGTVTGSKFLLETPWLNILVDCGMFQGLKDLRELNWKPFPISPTGIDFILLTHGHLDHTGYLPVLIKQGFKGGILGTSLPWPLLK